MRTRSAGTARALALVGLALVLAACGVGSVSQAEVTAEAQRRGGGVTADLVDDAVAEVAAATGERPLAVHSITATLTAVTIVVPADDRSSGRDGWRYGTSGLYGGRGLEGPTPVEQPALGTFPVDVGDLGVDVDEAVATARQAGDPGAWVESLTIARTAEGADPVVSVVVTTGGEPTTVVLTADGSVVEEGPR